MNYMGTVLKGKPETPLLIPDGVVRVAINLPNGLVLEGEQKGQAGVPDYIYQENVPLPRRTEDSPGPDGSEKSLERLTLPAHAPLNLGKPQAGSVQSNAQPR